MDGRRIQGYCTEIQWLVGQDVVLQGRAQGKPDVVPLQQVFPVIAHPVPGPVVELLHEGVKVQVVVIRGAGNLQYGDGDGIVQLVGERLADQFVGQQVGPGGFQVYQLAGPDRTVVVVHFFQDRKSTRLNSSHVRISYAV